MATYSIRTTRAQEIGLKFVYDNLPNKTEFPTQESFLQYNVDTMVTDPMYARQQSAQLTAFDQSFNTVPETEQPAARTEIEGVITAHGGTIVDPNQPVTNPNFPGGTLSAPRGTSGNPIQIGGTDTSAAPPSGRDGGGDNEASS